MLTKPPFISPELLTYLDELYPERVPELTWEDRKIWASVGERRLVRHLHHLATNQNKEALTNHVQSTEADAQRRPVRRP